MMIYIPLDATENRALHDLADRECRDRRSQARYIIRRELERAGLLQPTPEQPDYGAEWLKNANR